MRATTHWTPETTASPKLNAGADPASNGPSERTVDQRQRRRALKREHRGLVALVDQRRAVREALEQVLEITCAVRGVDHQQVAAGLPVGDQVVDDPPRLVRQQRVLRLAGCDLVEIVRQQALQVGVRVPAEHRIASHVRDVEDANATPHGPVLLDHASVLDGHRPAGERHHARPEGNMARVQRRLPQGRGHGR